MKKPANKSPSQRGRKAEGRSAKMIRMRPEAWATLDARLRGRSDTRGRVIERMLANPDLPPETKKEDRMETEAINTAPYYICLADPKGEIPEPWLEAAGARLEAAAQRIGLEMTYRPCEDDLYEIDWVTHAIGKGRRFNTRQWEMWLRRECTAPDIALVETKSVSRSLADGNTVGFVHQSTEGIETIHESLEHAPETIYKSLAKATFSRPKCSRTCDQCGPHGHHWVISLPDVQTLYEKYKVSDAVEGKYDADEEEFFANLPWYNASKHPPRGTVFCLCVHCQAVVCVSVDAKDLPNV